MARASLLSRFHDPTDTQRWLSLPWTSDHRDALLPDTIRHSRETNIRATEVFEPRRQTARALESAQIT